MYTLLLRHNTLNKQVPQFILDDPEMGPRCSIVCTQPRRISAIAVAERIADERCEEAGALVGYTIRLESVMTQSVQVGNVELAVEVHVLPAICGTEMDSAVHDVCLQCGTSAARRRARWWAARFGWRAS
jgi:hypothetical protein